MAEEQVASPLPSDLKRKFDDFDSQPNADVTATSHTEPLTKPDDSTVSPPDDSDNKRPRIHDELHGLGITDFGFIFSYNTLF